MFLISNKNKLIANLFLLKVKYKNKIYDIINLVFCIVYVKYLKEVAYMRKKMNLFFKLIIVLVLALGFTYYFSFYPKNKVTNISDSSNFNSLTLLDKLSKNDLKLSSKEISFETSLTLSKDDLTSIFIDLIKKSNNNLSNLITGLNVDINENKINLIFHLNYNNIPLEGRLVFTPASINGKCVLHYDSGKIGFLNIDKDLIFSKLKSNELVTFDKDNKDIILSMNNLNNVQVNNVKIKDNNIVIEIKGTLTLDDLNKIKLN